MSGLKQFLWFFAVQSQSASRDISSTLHFIILPDSNMCKSYPLCFTFRPISRRLAWISSTMTSRVWSEKFWLAAELKPNHLFSFAFSHREVISTNQVQATLACFHFTSSLESRCINCCVYQQAPRAATKFVQEGFP